MDTELKLLHRAIERVRDEQRHIQREHDAFETFRQRIGRARTVAVSGPECANETGDVLEAYRETVASAIDTEAEYGQSVDEHLRTELSTSVASTILSDGSENVTHRFKRDLLLSVTETIEDREAFEEILKAERDSLRTTNEGLLDIKRRLDRVADPSETVRGNVDSKTNGGDCERVIEKCDRLSKRRQQRVADHRRVAGHLSDDAHSLNRYLYAGLETEFPAIRAIATTWNRLTRHCDEAVSRPEDGIEQSMD